MKRDAVLFLIIFLCTAVYSVSAVEQYVLETKWGTSGIGDGQFNQPSGIAVDRAGTIYVTDTYGYRVMKFASDGTFITKWGTKGTRDGQFCLPYGITVDKAGNVYVSDLCNHRVQKFTSNGTFITKWGGDAPGFDGWGSGDGQFAYPYGVTADATGTVYIADSFNHRIQKFTSDGTFITKWGTNRTGGEQFIFPLGIAVDKAGVVYALDISARVQAFTPFGTPIAIWRTKDVEDLTLEEMMFSGRFPGGIALDGAGNVYVSDAINDCVRKFTTDGTPITKWGTNGTGDGQFNRPIGIAVDDAGNVYVADSENNRIQKFAPRGTNINKASTNNGPWIQPQASMATPIPPLLPVLGVSIVVVSSVIRRAVARFEAGRTPSGNS